LVTVSDMAGTFHVRLSSRCTGRRSGDIGVHAALMARDGIALFRDETGPFV